MRLSSFELSQEQLFYQPCLSSRFSLLFLRFVFISVFLSLICVCVGFWEGDWPAKKVFSKFGELTKKVSCSTEVKERGEIFSKKHFQNTTCKGKMDLVASWQGKIKLPSFTFDETQANSKQNQSSWLWKVEIDSLKNFWQLAVVSRFKISLDLKAEGDWCELETNAWTKKLVWRVCFLVVSYSFVKPFLRFCVDCNYCLTDKGCKLRSGFWKICFCSVKKWKRRFIFSTRLKTPLQRNKTTEKCYVFFS